MLKEKNLGRWKHTKGEPFFTKKVMYKEYYSMQ
jgi:hypothetical protein